MRLSSKPSDQGITNSKFGKVDKASAIIDFTGCIEELIAYYAELGYLIRGRLDYAVEQIMGDLSSVLEEVTKPNIEIISRYNVLWVEENIRELKKQVDGDSKGLPYVYNMAASKASIIRCKVKEAERKFFKLKKMNPMNEFIGQYFNRLSDYTFYFYKVLNQNKKRFVEMEEK